jgi:hypothetical protein
MLIFIGAYFYLMARKKPDDIVHGDQGTISLINFIITQTLGIIFSSIIKTLLHIFH